MNNIEDIRHYTKSSGPITKELYGYYSDIGLFGELDNNSSYFLRWLKLKSQEFELNDLEDKVKLMKFF
jgi:hypothetical protein